MSLELIGEVRSNLEQGALGSPTLSPITKRDEDVESRETVASVCIVY